MSKVKNLDNLSRADLIIYYENMIKGYSDSQEEVFAENKKLQAKYKLSLERTNKYMDENKYRRDEQARYYNSAENRIKCLEQKLDSATTLIKNLRVFNPELVDAWFKAIDKGDK